MKKTLFLCAALVMFGTLASAQAPDGGISEEMLAKIRTGYSGTQAQKAAKNALSRNSIAALSTNSDNLSMIDTHFSHKVTTNGITDQASSGRCWLFTGMNVLRSKMINEKQLNSMNFSHIYLFFYDQLEKSNLFLQAIIDTRKSPMDDKTVEWLFRNPLSDGGTFTGVADLVAKYGVVPQGIMPETYASNNTSRFTSLIKRKLREYALELRSMKGNEQALQNAKKEMLADIDGVVFEDNMGVMGWYGNKRLIMGNREHMKHHSIKVPELSAIAKYSRGGAEAVYLAVGGELAIIFFVRLTANQNIRNCLCDLTDRGVSLIVKTTDSLVSAAKIADLFDIDPEKVKVIGSNLHEIFTENTKYTSRGSGGITCNGSFLSFGKAILAAKKLGSDGSLSACS